MTHWELSKLPVCFGISWGFLACSPGIRPGGLFLCLEHVFRCRSEFGLSLGFGRLGGRLSFRFGHSLWRRQLRPRLLCAGGSHVFPVALKHDGFHSVTIEK